MAPWADSFPRDEYPLGPTVDQAAKAMHTEIGQLRRDRDDLAAALEKAVAFHWEDEESDPEVHQDFCRALLARVKAGR